uniref:Uncharacterized protein n=1 Tax=Romanomermis culicivorax TaxID=13658 RepID=A0A915J5K0_ROMCU
MKTIDGDDVDADASASKITGKGGDGMKIVGEEGEDVTKIVGKGDDAMKIVGEDNNSSKIVREDRNATKIAVEGGDATVNQKTVSTQTMFVNDLFIHYLNDQDYDSASDMSVDSAKS